MEIREIKNKEIWEGFFENCAIKTFLNSWNWGTFQEKEGNKIWRFGLYQSGELASVFYAIKIKAKRGSFLFVPHGPNFKSQDSLVIENLFAFISDFLKKLTKEEGVSFLRISSLLPKNDENIKIFSDLGFKEAPTHVHYETTWKLDINGTEEKILSGMRKTTRYLVRQAEKNPDIRIIKSQETKDLEEFSRIYMETVKRHHFVPFRKNYLQKEMESFLNDGEIVIFLAKYKEETVSSAIVIFWQDTAYYHHGASLSKYNNNKIPASYLIQWEIIKEAKKRGCKLYDFWGVIPEIVKDTDKYRNHPWAGFSLFKIGFGGQLEEFVKTQDYPVTIGYYPTYLIERIRKIKRRL